MQDGHRGKPTRSRLPRVAAAIGGGALTALLPGTALSAGTLNLIPDPTITGILLIAFVVFIYPLNALIFRPLFGVIDERDDRITGARRRGAKLEQDAQATLDRYREAIEDVRASSESDRLQQLESARGEQTRITGEARREAEAQLARGRQDLERELAAARSGLRATAEELARDAASRILGRSLS